jgi:hypothetical protein
MATSAIATPMSSGIWFRTIFPSSIISSAATIAGVVGVWLGLASTTDERKASHLAAGYGEPLVLFSELISFQSICYALLSVTPRLAYELVIRR